MAQVKQPADKSHFILPDLGEGVHEAELIKWRVSAGDQVAEYIEWPTCKVTHLNLENTSITKSMQTMNLFRNRTRRNTRKMCR